MPAYQITYERKDMPKPCDSIKFAHTQDDALKLLCTGNKKKGFRLTRQGIPVKITNIKGLDHYENN